MLETQYKALRHTYNMKVSAVPVNITLIFGLQKQYVVHPNTISGTVIAYANVLWMDLMKVSLKMWLFRIILMTLC